MILFPTTIESIDVVLVSTNAIHVSGNALGALMKLPNAIPNMGGLAKIVKVVVTDASKQSAKIVLEFFRSKVATGVDHTVFAPTAADQLESLGTIVVNTTDYQAFSANSIATVTIPEGFPVKVRGGKDVYVQAIVYGTPTYAAGATDVHLRLDFERQ